MPVRKVKQEIEMVGRKKGADACPNCVTLDEKYRADLPKAPIPTKYKFISEDTTQGKQMIKEHKIKYVPFVKKCTTYSNGKTRCKIIR